MAIINKPETVQRDISTPVEIKPIPPANCRFKRIIHRNSSYGESIFEAAEPAHQFHSRDFSCNSVVEMEKSGHHAELCPHVGYWMAEKCGCNNGR